MWLSLLARQNRGKPSWRQSAASELSQWPWRMETSKKVYSQIFLAKHNHWMNKRRQEKQSLRMVEHTLVLHHRRIGCGRNLPGHQPTLRWIRCTGCSDPSEVWPPAGSPGTGSSSGARKTWLPEPCCHPKTRGWHAGHFRVLCSWVYWSGWEWHRSPPHTQIRRWTSLRHTTRHFWQKEQPLWRSGGTEGRSLTGEYVKSRCVIRSQPRPQHDRVCVGHQVLGKPVLVPKLIGGLCCRLRRRCGISRGRSALIVSGLLLDVHNGQSDDGGDGSRRQNPAHYPNNFTDVEAFPHRLRFAWDTKRERLWGEYVPVDGRRLPHARCTRWYINTTSIKEDRTSWGPRKFCWCYTSVREYVLYKVYE